jgi:VWFA-related protein
MRLSGTVLCAAALLLVGIARSQPANPQNEQAPVIRAETRLVLVDAVVTDKKGNYVRDLEAGDFRVWEDNKEQAITSFSREADVAAPSQPRQHYLVLFFDYTTMDSAQQVYARQAAAKFIDAQAGPQRLMAVASFGGSLHVVQDFTASTARLKRALGGQLPSLTLGGTAEVATTEMPTLSDAQLGYSSRLDAAASFAVRTSLLALRRLAQQLGAIPGRKILVLFTGGFPLNVENLPEVTAAIDACNKANVAVYPIDVRGLVADAPGRGALDSPRPRKVRMLCMQRDGGRPGGSAGGGTGSGSGSGGRASPGSAAGMPGGSIGGAAAGAAGGAARGAAGNVSGGAYTGRGGTMRPGTNTNAYPQRTPLDQRPMIPKFPQSATTNQQVLYALADGTGGFVILNTNDLAAGLEKIGKEQEEYYLLGYAAPESAEGSCHVLRVKVNRGGTVVRARNGYCNVKAADVLAKKPAGKDLETRAASSLPGTIPATMEAPFFYTAPDRARVNLAMDIAPDTIRFEKVKGKYHAEVNVLGMAYKPDGTVAARFSDIVKLDLDGKRDVDKFKKEPLHYENQFEIASGQYELKVAFGAGGADFGKLAVPLAIDPYDGKKIALSGMLISDRMDKVDAMDTSLDTALMEDRKPLVVRGMLLTPSGANRLKKNGTSLIYAEIYDPQLLGAFQVGVGIQLRVLDRKTGEEKFNSGNMLVSEWVKKGSTVVPIVFNLAPVVEKLAGGSYRAELRALDSTGASTTFRQTDFELE